MDKIYFSRDLPAGLWNADQLADEIKKVFHNCKIYGKVTFTFEKPFCKIKQITMSVRKEKTEAGYKTYVTVLDVLYIEEYQSNHKSRTSLGLIKNKKSA